MSQPQSYIKLHNNVRLDKTLSRLWAEPLKISIPAEAEEGKKHMKEGERGTRQIVIDCSIHNELSINTISLLREYFPF